MLADVLICQINLEVIRGVQYFSGYNKFRHTQFIRILGHCSEGTKETFTAYIFIYMFYVSKRIVVIRRCI